MSIGELPLIFCLPPEQILSLGPRLIEAGTDAISIAAPRGSLMQNGSFVFGRLFGPSLLPQSLEIVHSAAKLGLPMIGAGGVYSKDDVEAMLTAGAFAVQMDAKLWLPQE
jgi:dihydroorotate dehydrogenase